jgi:hypothetical protein
MSRDAIVLHALWRSASTYIWAKFRERTDTLCYFEPMNEHLATATPQVIDLFQPWSFAHHPKLDKPYLEEFRPLLATGGGIAGFPAHLTYGRYCADRHARLPELAAYFARLARHAEDLGRVPVYGHVRTALRVDWFRAHVPGRHIFIRRAPRGQFMSMLTQAVRGNPYFLQRGLVILSQNLDEPAFAPLLLAMGNRDLPITLAGLSQLFAEAATQPPPPLPQFYTIFYYLYLLAARRGEPCCELVIDIDQASRDPSSRRDTETRIADLTGMAISLADCAVERYERHLGLSNDLFAELENTVEALLPPSLGALDGA